MRIEKVTLRNFRGVKESVIEFGPGVTVVAGPNEVGKSSIAEALRLLRSAKHSSKAGAIRSLQPVGRDVGPEVELEFTSRGRHVWVRKQWLREAATELRISGPQNEQLSGDEAHERLGTFLAEHMDVELFDALEVLQGESLEEARLVGLRSLSGALGGAGPTARDHDELMDRIEEEYHQHFTPTGRPKGPYQQRAKRIEELEAERAGVIEQSREMDEFTADIERQRAQLADDESDLEQARVLLQESTERDTALTGLREGVITAQADVDEAEKAVRSAQEACEARELLRREVQQRQEALAGVAERVTAWEAEFAALETTIARRTRARDDAQERAEETRARARAAAQAVQRAADHQEIEALRTRIADAQKAREDHLQAVQVIANSNVDSALLARIGEREAELNIATATRDAAVAQVRITPAGPSEVRRNGQVVDEETEFLLTEPVTIAAEDAVTVEVRPGVLPEDLDREVQRATAALTELFEQGAVHSVPEARAVAAARAEAESGKELAQQALSAALAGETLDDLQERFAVLKDRLGEHAEAPGTGSGGAGALRQASQEAEEAAEEAHQHLTAAQEALEEQNAKTSQIRESMIRAQSERDHLLDEHKRAAQSLEAAREKTSDADLDGALASARARADRVAESLTAANESLQAANPEAIEIELENATAWVKSAAERLEETRLRGERLTALLEDRASRGLYEELQRIETELQVARDEYARLDRRARAAELLRGVMQRRRDEAHARYVAPFAARIESLGRIVFGPDFTVEITPDLQIASRTLEGQTVPFEALSAGAREQLGLLGRLAAAAIVDADEGAPLILDDTLGFADEDRLGSLNAVLNDVGKSAQIIILTCQPRRFSRIGGADIVHLSPSGMS